MSTLRSAFRRVALASVLVLGAAGCDNDNPVELKATSVAYGATTFRVTPAGQPTIDVLAQGGYLDVTIATNDVTSGSLMLPASVTGGTALRESMAGTAVRTATTVNFIQPADTFVRDLTFTINNGNLQVVNQQAGAATFTITLSRVLPVD